MRPHGPTLSARAKQAGESTSCQPPAPVPAVLSLPATGYGLRAVPIPYSDSVRLSPRTRDLAELAIGYGLILTTIWTPNPAQRILYWTAFAWIAITAILRRKETAPNGLGLRGLLPSLWIVAAAIVVFLAGHRPRRSPPHPAPALRPAARPHPHLRDTRSGR